MWEFFDGERHSQVWVAHFLNFILNVSAPLESIVLDSQELKIKRATFQRCFLFADKLGL